MSDILKLMDEKLPELSTCRVCGGKFVIERGMIFCEDCGIQYAQLPKPLHTWIGVDVAMLCEACQIVFASGVARPMGPCPGEKT